MWAGAGMCKYWHDRRYARMVGGLQLAETFNTTELAQQPPQFIELLVSSNHLIVRSQLSCINKVVNAGFSKRYCIGLNHLYLGRWAAHRSWICIEGTLAKTCKHWWCWTGNGHSPVYKDFFYTIASLRSWAYTNKCRFVLPRGTTCRSQNSSLLLCPESCCLATATLTYVHPKRA